jgi:hypothetical protein
MRRIIAFLAAVAATIRRLSFGAGCHGGPVGPAVEAIAAEARRRCSAAIITASLPDVSVNMPPAMPSHYGDSALNYFFVARPRLLLRGCSA